MTLFDLIRRKSQPWLQAIAGNTAVRLFTFGTGVLLARALGPAGRGLITVAMLWPGVMISFGSVINAQTSTYFGARFGRRGTDVCVRLAMLNALLLMAIALTANWLIVRAEYPALYGAANIFALSVPLSMFGAVYSGALLSGARIGWYWVVRVVTSAVPFVGVLFLLFLHRLTVENYVLAVVSGLAIALVVARSGVSGIDTGTNSSEPDARAVASYGGQVVITSLPSQVNFRVDQLLLTLLAAPTVIGEYAVATTWSSVVSVIGTAFGTVVQSESARVDANDPVAVACVLRDMRRAFVVLAVIALTAIPFASAGLPLIFGKRFAPAVAPAMLLCAAALLTNAKLLIRDFGRGLGQPALPLSAEVAGAMVRLPALLLLVPMLGALGAAFASALSAATTLVVLGLVTGRRVRHVRGRDLLPRVRDFHSIVAPIARTLGHRSWPDPLNGRENSGGSL